MSQQHYGQPPLRRDSFVFAYKNAADFHKHAAQMRQAGWQIGPHHQRGARASVTWVRDVPPHVAPGAFLPPPPSAGIPAIGIVGIVLGGLLLLGIIASVANSPSSAQRTATAGGRVAASPTPRQASPSVASTPSGAALSLASPSTTGGTPQSSAVGAVSAPATPQVVTVVDKPVEVRQSASQDAPVLFTLDVGTELSVLGPDTTGPDGATRWVHVAANGTDGYVRSDLVSPARVFVPPTATPIPTASPTPEPDRYAAYPLIDAADLVKRPDYYVGKRFSAKGEAFNVHESKGVTTFQVWAETSLGKTVPIGVVFNNTSSLVDGNTLRVYGLGKGTFTGTNGFGASITQPLMDAEYIGPPTDATNMASATADANKVKSTVAAIDRDIVNLNATGTAIVVDATASQRQSNAAKTAGASTVQAIVATTSAEGTAGARSFAATGTAAASSFAPRATPKP